MAPHLVFIAATSQNFARYHLVWARTPKVHGFFGLSGHLTDKMPAVGHVFTCWGPTLTSTFSLSSSLRIFIFLLIILTSDSFISFAPPENYCAMSSIYRQ